jgi:glycerophosphoryl diester phosphodiesterase
LDYFAVGFPVNRIGRLVQAGRMHAAYRVDHRLVAIMNPRCHTLPFALAAILSALLAGCALPAHTQRLDAIIAQEAVYPAVRYGYRCTAGAHRGASVEYRENTVAALKAADADRKYAFIEFDVQYSKDRRMVVYHDQRMLRLHGSLRAIGDASFAELVEITQGEIAAYDEVVGSLAKKINIEIKSRGDFAEDARLADDIIADIRGRQRLNDLLISSISGDLIRYVHQKYPGVPTGQIFWLKSSTYLPFEALTQKLYAEVAATGADYLMLHIANLHNIDALLRHKPRGKTIVFWDFDDTMYIVHKDFSDRLWGDSWFKTVYGFLRFKLAAGNDR